MHGAPCGTRNGNTSAVKPARGNHSSVHGGGCRSLRVVRGAGGKCQSKTVDEKTREKEYHEQQKRDHGPEICAGEISLERKGQARPPRYHDCGGNQDSSELAHVDRFRYIRLDFGNVLVSPPRL